MRAVVFDFDGVILDTEGPIFTTWNETFAAHGCPPMTIDEWSAEIGTQGGLDMDALLVERATLAVDLDAVTIARRARRDELLALEHVQPGIDAWITAAETAGMRVAIASSSSELWVAPHLERLGLRERFEYIACWSERTRPKPAPDLYLEACAALGVDPRDALAVEDSPNGIAAAKAAGLRCIAVPHAITVQLDLSAADLIVPSLADISLSDTLAQLLR